MSPRPRCAAKLSTQSTAAASSQELPSSGDDVVIEILVTPPVSQPSKVKNPHAKKKTPDIRPKVLNPCGNKKVSPGSDVARLPDDSDVDSDDELFIHQPVFSTKKNEHQGTR